MENHPLDRKRFTVEVFSDDTAVLDSVSKDLADPNWLVLTSQDQSTLLENLDHYGADLIFLDSKTLGGIHSDLANVVRTKAPQSNWILLVEPSHLQHAVIAVQEGVADYMIKPVVPQEAQVLAKKFHQFKVLENENVKLRSQLSFLQRCVEISSSLDVGDVLSWSLDMVSELLASHASAACLIQKDSLNFIQTRGHLDPKLLRKNAKLLSTKERKRKSWEVALDDRVFYGQTLFETEASMAFFLFDRDPWESQEMSSLKQLLRYTQTGLKNALKFEQNQGLVFMDDLTGLYNSRYLNQFLEKELKRADRQDYPVSFLFVDLDRFKPINDRHGHMVGSRLLARVAKTFSDLVRDVDVLIRYGGDEYVIILINTNTSGAKLVAERIRSEIVSTDYLQEMGIDNSEKLRLSASIGLATYPTHSRDPKEILKLADEAMYQAKEKSRNAVAVAVAVAVEKPSTTEASA